MGKLATHPVLFGVTQCPNTGEEMKNGPQMGTLDISPLRFGGPPRFKAANKTSSRLHMSKSAI